MQSINNLVWLMLILRVMSNAKLKDFFRPIPDHGREDVKNVEEQCVTPTVTNFGIRFPYHFQARIYADSIVQNFGEAFEWYWILFAGRAMNHFGNFQFTCANVPAHGQRWINNIIAWNDIDGWLCIAIDGAKQSFVVAGKESKMTAICISNPALNWMLVCTINCKKNRII